VDFVLKHIKWSQDTLVRLQLWDIAGQERFGNMTRVFYREAVGVVVAFDATRPATFDGIQKWTHDVNSKAKYLLPDGTQVHLPTIVVATKCDELKGGEWLAPVPKEEMDSYCERNGFLGWYQTSAKAESYLPTIENAFRTLINKVIEYGTTDLEICSSPPISLVPTKPASETDPIKCNC